MADTQIEAIKSQVDLAALVRDSGVELQGAGAELKGRCPFHEDDVPSLSVNPDKGVWRCFGCRAGGSCFDWVMKRDGISFRRAKEILAARLAGQAPTPGRERRCSLPSPLTVNAGDRQLLKEVVDYYWRTLQREPGPRDYLRRRGLVDERLVDTFKLGYANRTLAYRLPPKSRTKEDDLRGRLMKVGILREESGHEHLSGSLTIPVFDEHGDVVELYGRKILDNLRKGTPKHLYLERKGRPDRGVWNLKGLVGHEEIILCEALIDALTFWQAGFTNVTTSYGADVFSSQQLETYRRLGVKRVVIAFDRDEAGNNGAAKVASFLLLAGIAPFRALFPNGMDANAYALKVSPAPMSLGIVLQAARWMGDGAAPARANVLATPSLPAAVVTEVTSPAVPALEEEPPVVAAEAEEEDVEPMASPLELEEDDVDDAPPVLEPSPLSAAPPPPAAAARPTEPQAPRDPDQVELEQGDRRYRVRGLAKNTSHDLLKVNVMAMRGDVFHVDTLDLYSARQRQAFVRNAAVELGLREELLKKDLGKILLELEAMQDEQIKKTLEPKEKVVILDDDERATALELLQAPDLVARIVRDLERCGLVGERVNKLTCYLAAVSRKLPRPLAVVVQSTSAAGKSAVMDAILAMMPEEERVRFSALTGQALYYLGSKNLKHKILAISEEQGASRASYSLKLLQSEGRLTIASTGKNPTTGELETKEYEVEGPVMLILTTTAIDIDEELLNRCIVLCIREDREQTRAIHELQRELETIDGILAMEDRERILKLHQDAQRLLQPLRVSNPYAKRLTFIDTQTRTRRDNPKYLTLIRAIALLHQYQRPRLKRMHQGREVEYIEATLEDIALANELANEVLGRSLDDMPQQTRDLLLLLDRMVTEASAAQGVERADVRFSQREARGFTGWSDTQVKRHLKRLEELEYVLVHRARRGQSFEYELLYEGQGQDGGRFLLGLADVADLRAAYDGNRGGLEAGWGGGNGSRGGSGAPQVRAKSGVVRAEPIAVAPRNGNGSRGSGHEILENAYRAQETAIRRAASYAPPESDAQGA